MKIFRSKWFRIILVIGIIGLVIFFVYKKSNSSQDIIQTTTNVTVERGDISDGIDVVGTAELANEQKLRFAQTGKITEIFVKAGDSVEKWDVLASLDKREFFQELSQAQNQIDKTQRQINEEREKSHGTEAKKMEREIASMQRKLAEMESEFSKSVRTSPQKAEEKLLELNAKKRDLESQKEKYTLDKQTYETELAAQENLVKSRIEQGQKLIENTIQAAGTEFSDVRQIHRDINILFGFDTGPLSNNERFIANFVGSDAPGNRANVENEWREALNYIRNYEKISGNIDRSSKKMSDAQGLNSEALRVYKKLLETLDLARKAADFTPNEDGSHGLSKSDFNAVMSSISTMRSTVQGKISSLTENRDSFLTLESPEKITEKVKSELNTKKFALEALADAIKKLELQIKNDEDSLQISPDGFIKDENLQREILDKQSAIEDQKDAITTKKEELEKMKNGKSDTLENLQSTLKDQLSELEKLKAKEEQYEIRAPFAGNIRTIKMKVGDVLGSNDNKDDEKVIMLENADIINIKVSLNQLDIIKVKIGQEADITFEAIPEAVLTGSITEISSTPSNNTSGNYASYDVIVSADRGEYPIFSGMNANIKITLSGKNNVLLLPITAVSTDNETGDNYVNLVKNGSVIKTTVQIGQSSNGMMEITEGLSEGDEVQMIDFNANIYKESDFTSSF